MTKHHETLDEYLDDLEKEQKKECHRRLGGEHHGMHVPFPADGPPLTRRQVLARLGGGFGSIAVAAVLGELSPLSAAARASGPAQYDLKPKPPHFPAKARAV